MSRYTGPTTKLNRRFGQNIFPTSKGEERRPYPPGIHGIIMGEELKLLMQQSN